jgi:long-subunit acyl-CoA synthetase (AMP-forming)
VQVKLSEEGEILIKSPGQLVGYYKRPDLDKEVFTEDGYFRTGDKGERQPNGMLKLTGRIKELFKTSKGKYVAPAPIENHINAHHMIELSMVSGVGQPSAYAMVVLAETIRPQQMDVQFRKEVESELTQLLKDVNKELADYEKLQMIVVAREPWTIENGLLTPTMKIRRNRIETAIESNVEGWFSGKSKVLWA